VFAPRLYGGVVTLTGHLYLTTQRLFGQIFQAMQALEMGAVLAHQAFILTAIFIGRLETGQARVRHSALPLFAVIVVRRHPKETLGE